MLSIAHVW